MNYLKILKNNWKKSTFVAGALCYGAYSLKNHIEITNHMRSICSKVLDLENDPSYFSSPKSVLVIMNPVANKKNAEKMFKKYCEPILHLAGYNVEIVKTNYVGHAKSLVANISMLPDVIVVAGGDGTSSEVVTGLMRRKGPTCPIVLIPLGKANTTAYRYAGYKPKSNLDYLKFLPSAVLPLIYERLRYENVIKFDVIDEKGDETTTTQKNLKSIYGLNQFSWGLLHDIQAIKEKYWYFGTLKHYAAALLNAYSKDLNWNLVADFKASPPCPGCSNCIVKEEIAPRSYLRKLLPLRNKDEVVTDLKSSIVNDICSTITQGRIETSQLNIMCNRNNAEYYELEAKAISSLDPGWEFIKNIGKITKDEVEPSLVMRSRTIQLFPTLSQEGSAFYSIDGEEYDVRPIKMTLLQNAIKVFS